MHIHNSCVPPLHQTSWPRRTIGHQHCLEQNAWVRDARWIANHQHKEVRVGVCVGEREKQDVITPFLFFWPALHSLVAHFEVTSELSHTWLSCLRFCQRVRGKINEIPLSYQSTIWLLFLKAPSLESETAKCWCPGLKGFLNNCNILLLQPSPCLFMLFISPTATSINLKFWNLVTLTSQFPTFDSVFLHLHSGRFLFFLIQIAYSEVAIW